MVIVLLLCSSSIWFTCNYKFDGEGLYKGYGIVFESCYKPPITIPGYRESFTPSKDEINFAEEVFFKKYNSTLLEDNRVGSHKIVNNVKKTFWFHNRQYIGYIDNNGDKKILINLLNFKNTRRAERNFINWETTYFVGFGRFYEKNVITFLVDIETTSLYLW